MISALLWVTLHGQVHTLGRWGFLMDVLLGGESYEKHYTSQIAKLMGGGDVTKSTPHIGTQEVQSLLKY